MLYQAKNFWWTISKTLPIAKTSYLYYAAACRGGRGERGDGPRHPRQGASKEWNYKNL